MTQWPLQVVACAMQKGGAGKTTTAVHLAAALAKRGVKTCLVDVDAQRNTSGALGFDLDAHKGPTVRDIYMHGTPAIDVVVDYGDRFDGNLGLIPSHIGLNTLFTKIELSLVNQALDKDLTLEDQEDLRREAADRLRESLKTLGGTYDVAVIDTPPSLGFLLSTALRATDWLIIPVEPGEFAMDGLRDLTTSVNKIRERSNPRLKLFRIVVTKYDSRKTLHREYVENLREECGPVMFDPIKMGVCVEECPSNQQTIFENAPTSEQAKQYEALAAEFITEVENHLSRVAALAKVRQQRAEAAVGEG